MKTFKVKGIKTENNHLDRNTHTQIEKHSKHVPNCTYTHKSLRTPT